MSDFTQSYDAFWATPIVGRFEPSRSERPGSGVNYSLEVLEGFDRVIRTRVNALSSVADGGTCGVELTIGAPQFIVGYKLEDGLYGLSSCAPYLPYEAIKLYLTSGEDTYIPAWSDCYNWPKDDNNLAPMFNEFREDCAVWEDTGYINPNYFGTADLKKYRQLWWERHEKIFP